MTRYLNVSFLLLLVLLFLLLRFAVAVGPCFCFKDQFLLYSNCHFQFQFSSVLVYLALTNTSILFISLTRSFRQHCQNWNEKASLFSTNNGVFLETALIAGIVKYLCCCLPLIINRFGSKLRPPSNTHNTQQLLFISFCLHYAATFVHQIENSLCVLLIADNALCSCMATGNNENISFQSIAEIQWNLVISF